MKRYGQSGIEGLQVKAGRGRKAILQKETDLAAVRRAVQDNRPRIRRAKAQREKESGKAFRPRTLTRFLKKTVTATNGLGG